MEEPFTEVVSKAKKKNSHKGVNVHNTRAKKNRFILNLQIFLCINLFPQYMNFFS
jgi:hypothetical protein